MPTIDKNGALHASNGQYTFKPGGDTGSYNLEADAVFAKSLRDFTYDPNKEKFQDEKLNEFLSYESDPAFEQYIVELETNDGHKEDYLEMAFDTPDEVRAFVAEVKNKKDENDELPVVQVYVTDGIDGVWSKTF